MCHGREREAPGAVVQLPSLPPPIYRPPGGAPALEIRSKGGRRPSGGKGCLAPQGKGEAPPPLGFPTLGAWGEAHGGRPAH